MALLHSRLSCCLQCLHAVSECQFESQLTLLLLQLPANAPVERGKCLGSATPMEYLEFLVPGFGLVQPEAIVDTRGMSEWNISLSSPSLSFFYYFSFQINLFREEVRNNKN